MHSNNHPAQNPSRSSFILRHLFLLIGAIAVLAVLYIETQNLTVAGAGAVLLVLAHVVAVVVIAYSGRSILRGVFLRMHGQPITTTHDHSQEHGHSHHHADDLQTEGVTLTWAGLYDLFTRVVFGGQVKKMMQSTVRLANIQAGETALDVGCGTGTLAILAKQTAGPNATLYGTDAAPQMIQRAQEKARAAQVDVNFQAGLVEKIQFADGTFDVVMNSLMFHHLPSLELKQAALAEMYRVLKPGGRLLIVDFEPPKRGLPKAFLTLILGDMTAIDNTIVPPLLQKAGFVNVTMGPTDSKVATYIAGIKPTT
ncbi:MAG: methyltransferase domain-containing protein [Anaerolineae bacterium]|nr:methyltransferase domain-containing protein [Anaerolineae bacterium]